MAKRPVPVAARWATTPVAARLRERQPGVLARRRGSGRQQADGGSCNRGKQGRHPIPPERPTVDDSAVPEIGEEHVSQGRAQ
jgi:hypothetical protein